MILPIIIIITIIVVWDRELNLNEIKALWLETLIIH